MKKIISITVVMVLLLVGCVSKNVVNITFWTNLSGIQSQYGINGRNGAELYHMSMDNGQTFMNFTYDIEYLSDENDTDVAEEKLSKSIDEGSKMIIAHNSSSRYLSLLDLTNNTDIVFLGTIISTEKLHQLDDNFFAMIPVVDQQGTSLARHALNDDYERAVLVYDQTNESYSKRLVDAYEEMFSAHGGVVRKVVAFNSKEKFDFKALALSIQSAKPDHVVIVSGTIESALLTQRLKMMMPEIRIYHGLSAMNDAYLWNVGSDTDNIYFSGTYDVYSDSEKMKAFRESYVEEYGTIPTYSACYAHDAMMIAVKVMENVNSIDYENIKAFLLAHQFEGLMGPISFDSYGDTQDTYHIFSIKNGEFRKEEDE